MGGKGNEGRGGQEKVEERMMGEQEKKVKEEPVRWSGTEGVP